MKFLICNFILVIFFLSGCNKDVITDYQSPHLELNEIDNNASWSPDGTRIVFFYGGSVDSAGLFIIDTNGNNKTRVNTLTGEHPDWSPDGQWIAFNYNHNIYKKGLGSDTSTIQLTFSGDNSFPSWSYDGQWIAYQARTDESFAYIWKMKADGSEKKRIIYTPELGEVQMPDWFPDGVRLAVARYIGHGGAEIAIIDTSGNSLAILTNDGIMDVAPKVSKDNNITFVSYVNGGRITTMNSYGIILSFITSDRSADPCWSPDGQKIAYTNCIADDGRIWISSKDGKWKKRLTY